MYKSIRNYENINKGRYETCGKYDIPILKPTHGNADQWIGFNYAKSCKNPENKGVHFFLDDYQFIRMWNRADDYIPMLRKFKCVMTPDFSTYTDYPMALQIYNHYRKHWIGAHMQACGINVIPTISWSDKRSYEWCFDGEPIGGYVAVSSVGTQGNKICMELFKQGYEEMLLRLQPEKVLFYGKVPEWCSDDNIVEIPQFSDRYGKE